MRGRFWIRAGIVGAAAVLPIALATCTVFNDAVVPTDGGAEGGPTPPFNDFPTAFVDLEDAVRACRWAFECPTLPRSIGMSLALPLDADSLSTCAHWLAGPVPENRAGRATQAQVLRCVALADTCEGAAGCAYIEALDDDDDRCAGEMADAAPYCLDDATLVECQKQRLHRCTSERFQPGTDCRANADGLSTCAFQDCGDAGGDAGLYSCLNDVQFACIQSLLLGIDCRTEGLLCGTVLLCAAEEGALPEVCDTESPGTTDCAGEIARICDGIQRAHFRCGDLDGGSCEQAGGEGRCVLEGSTCAPADFDETPCDGETVSLCVMGTPVRFDCASVGLRCRPPSDGRSAYCGSPP